MLSVVERWPMAIVVVLLLATGCTDQTQSAVDSTPVSNATNAESTVGPVGSDGSLMVYQAADLPDGTEVVIEGMIVVEGDSVQLAQFLTDSFPPMYLSALPTHGIDTDAVAMISYPGDSDLWSDFYRLKGTINRGELHVSTIEHLRANDDRKTYEECQAALDQPNQPTGCPEKWLEALRIPTQ